MESLLLELGEGATSGKCGVKTNAERATLACRVAAETQPHAGYYLIRSNRYANTWPNNALSPRWTRSKNADLLIPIADATSAAVAPRGTAK